jgi:hypothetical protein
MVRPPLFALGLLTVSVPTAAAQRRVWFVGGAGAHFAEIQPAIQAAQPGDRIEVRSNLMTQPYQAFTLDRGLDLEGVPFAHVLPSRIVNVPAGQSARVGQFWFNDFTLNGTPLLTISQCAGAVLVTRCRTQSGLYGGLWAADASQLAVIDCVVQGTLVLTRSRVTIQNTVFRGADGFAAGSYGNGGHGGSGVAATGSVVHAFHSAFSGGRGGSGRCLPWVPGADGNGGDGIVSDGEVLLMAGCALDGGAAAAMVFCTPGTPGLAVRATGPSARVTSDCILNGGTAQVTMLPPLPAAVSPGVVARGNVATLTFSGTPGTVLWLYLDRTHGFLPLPGIDGPLLLTPTAIGLRLLAVGGSGSTPVPLAVPNDPSLANLLLFFQGVAFEVGRPLPSLTNLADLRIR